jgi:hypothetical protein
MDCYEFSHPSPLTKVSVRLDRWLASLPNISTLKKFTWHSKSVYDMYILFQEVHFGCSRGSSI